MENFVNLYLQLVTLQVRGKNNEDRLLNESMMYLIEDYFAKVLKRAVEVSYGNSSDVAFQMPGTKTLVKLLEVLLIKKQKGSFNNLEQELLESTEILLSKKVQELSSTNLDEESNAQKLEILRLLNIIHNQDQSLV